MLINLVVVASTCNPCSYEVDTEDVELKVTLSMRQVWDTEDLVFK